MTTYTAKKLYQWLPAIYRLQDAGQRIPDAGKGALQALLEILAGQAGALENDIAQLYDNWFIETCDEWVVPYLGNLLGVRLVHPVGAAGVYSLRPYVANTLAYRRRKGTAAVLEQLAHDITGWPARAVEFFEVLSATQHVNHIRLHNVRTPDLRDTDALELLGTPFESAAHTGEVRRISRQRGKYNIPNVGLFPWRLQSYAVEQSSPRAAGDALLGCYRFDPLGRDMRLFNRPQAEAEITHLAEEVNVPGPLRRRPLYDELEKRRQALAMPTQPASRYFGEQPAFEVFLKGQTCALQPEEIVICDLETWNAPASVESTRPKAEGGQETYRTQAAVDPVRGRLVCLTGRRPDAVSYSYGFSGDVGAGPYNRQASLAPEWLSRVKRQFGVTQKEGDVDGVFVFESLAKAVDEWHKQSPGSVGIIAILDSHTYESDDDLKITIPAGSELLIAAAGWPPLDGERKPGRAVLDELVPHLKLNLVVEGPDGGTGGKLLLNGLCIEGTVSTKIGSLELAHCTLPPGSSLRIDPQAQTTLSIERSIVGALSLPGGVVLRVVDSIVDSAAADYTAVWALDALGCDAEVQSSTILGGVQVRSLQAGNSIFEGNVWAERTQAGCVRFSYLHNAVRVPRRYRCQPDWAVQKEIAAELKRNPHLSKDERDSITRTVESRLYPAFASLTFGDPAYAQLRSTCPTEVRAGADDGAEMGVFRYLQQPQREANLRQALEEYLRFGLEAGILYVT